MPVPLLILLLGVAIGSAQAQMPVSATNTPDAFWTITTNVSPANEATIRQAGAGNQAIMAVLAGAQNQLEVNQSAVNNTATVRVTGQTNGLRLNQTGGYNTADLGITGDGNRLKISQDGGDIARLPGLTGDNGKLELIQRNGNNTIVADSPTALSQSTGPGAANLRIEQRGGATLHIQTGRPIGY